MTSAAHCRTDQRRASPPREAMRRLAKAPSPAWRDDAIRAARSEGMGVREIARLLDIDPAQVTRICQR